MNDIHIEQAPSTQNILDIFDGEWSSMMPSEFGITATPGFADLFHDARIHWLNEMFGPLRGLDILELSPLEGAHAYMLCQYEAATVTAVESNKKAF